MRQVAILGIGQTKVSEHWDKSLKELGGEACFAAMQDAGFTAVKHQSFVGAGYFDEVQLTVTGGAASTTALHGSTEEAQFHG